MKIRRVVAFIDTNFLLLSTIFFPMSIDMTVFSDTDRIPAPNDVEWSMIHEYLVTYRDARTVWWIDMGLSKEIEMGRKSSRIT